MLAFDPEFRTALESYEGPLPPKFNNVEEFVEFTNKTMRDDLSQLPPQDHIHQTKIPVQSFDGQQIFLRRFATDEMATRNVPQAAIVYAHGGGMVAASVDIYAPLISYLTDLVGLPIFAVEYRLATKETAGSARSVHDVFSGLKHLSENAALWNVDPSRIIIMGDSGGGGLAAGAALLARDRALCPPLAKQTILGTDGAGIEDAVVSVYAAPGRATDLKGLPSTFIDVGGLDLFLEEDMTYAAKLMTAGVEVELHVWPGLPHGFEIAKEISWTARAFEARVAALRRV